ncbi:hypothetical protein MC885_020182 [Smutsia gigantea]|nr:hypothetical protein MC885_020182 [Smutsia gigantea]
MERFRKSDEWASKKYSVKVITFVLKYSSNQLCSKTALVPPPAGNKQSQLWGGISLRESGIRGGVSNRVTFIHGFNSLHSMSHKSGYRHAAIFKEVHEDNTWEEK